MGNIHDVFKDDETNGTIVGGEYVCGHLYYGDRQALYRQLWAGSATELQQKAKEEKQRLLDENKEIARELWPDASLWNLRIY